MGGQYKDKDLERAAQKRARKRAVQVRLEYVNSVKMERGCADCGNNHPAVLDFHHLDPSTKNDWVSQLALRRYSWDRINAEIGKCVVLCANCHRMRHYNK